MTAAARDWATAAELAGLPGLPTSERGVKARAEREGWAARKRGGKGGGLEYGLGSLPAEARAARNPAAPRARLKAELDAGADALTREAGLARLAELDDAQRTRVEARAYLVQACREFIAQCGMTKETGQEAFAEKYRAGELLTVPDWVRCELPRFTARSIRNWAKDIRGAGLVGLADKRGTHRRGSGKIDTDPEVHDLVVGMIAATPHTSAKHVMRALRARFKGEPGRVPSYRTVQRFMANWKASNAQLFAALGNPDAWRSKYMAAGGDAAEAVTALNGLWEMDSSPGDVLLADGRRHAIIAAIDVWSRRVKMFVARTSNSVAIAACLRKSLLDWGVPGTIRMDNGSDYISRHITSILIGLKVERDLCLPGHPHLKPFIERVFGTMTRDMVEWLPGYIGHSVADRKDIEARAAQTRRLLKKGDCCELRMTPGEFQAFLDRWCEDIYAHDAHSGLGGRTPFERAAEWNGPVLGITDERTLDILLAEAPGDGGWRVVGKKGIRVDGLIYDHPALGGLEGSRVKLRYDDADVGRVYVFDADGPFICRAEAPEVTGVSRPAVAAARKGHQKKVMREGLRELKAKTKGARVEDIVGEIMAHGAAKSARLVAFPRARTPHETDDLMAAARAAGESLGERARPRELTPEELEAANATFAAMQAKAEPDNVTRLNPPPRDAGERPVFATDPDWARWIIDNRDKASPEEEVRLVELMRSNSFRLLVGRSWESTEPKPRKVRR